MGISAVWLGKGNEIPTGRPHPKGQGKGNKTPITRPNRKLREFRGGPVAGGAQGPPAWMDAGNRLSGSSERTPVREQTREADDAADAAQVVPESVRYQR